jgi:dUTP pyrophosphatase
MTYLATGSYNTSYNTNSLLSTFSYCSIICILRHTYSRTYYCKHGCEDYQGESDMNHSNSLNVKIKLLTPTAKLPEYSHSTDAGMDLHADEGCNLFISQSKVISTGVALAIPRGYFGLIRPRSGLAKSHKIVLCSSGVIDSGYRGEICVQLINHGLMQYQIAKGDRIAQLLILPVLYAILEEVEELPKSERGVFGHGSTGR